MPKSKRPPSTKKPTPTQPPLSVSHFIARRPFNLEYGYGNSPALPSSVPQSGGPGAALKIKAD